MTISKINAADAQTGEDGDKLLVRGSKMSMRLWKDEKPQGKEPHASPYETLGYVMAGRAELTIDGETVTLAPGDSYCVPADTEHKYKILEPFTALETLSPALKA